MHRPSSALPMARSMLLLLVAMLACSVDLAFAQSVSWTRLGSTTSTVGGAFVTSGGSRSFTTRLGTNARAVRFSAVDASGAPAQGGWNLNWDLVWRVTLNGDSTTRCNVTGTVGLYPIAIVDDAITASALPTGTGLALQSQLIGNTMSISSTRTTTLTDVQNGTSFSVQLDTANTWAASTSTFYMVTIMDLTCTGTAGSLSTFLPDYASAYAFSFQTVRPALIPAPPPLSPPAPPMPPPRPQAAPARFVFSLTTLWVAAASLVALWVM